MTKLMKRWEMDGIGSEQLKLLEAPIPKPNIDEVLVKVAAVSLNYRDKMVIGSGRGLPIRFPFTPGSDLAGTIIDAGEGVNRFELGDRVISTFTPDWQDGRRPGNARTPAYRTLGGYYPGVLSEYVALPQDWLVHAPTTLDLVRASTLPCSGLTAWFALVERGQLHAGETVVVEGTGGVALFGIQIAKAHGAQVIVSGSANKLERAKRLGATYVIDRHREDLVERVLEITSGRGADQVLELVGGDHLGKAAQIVAVGGHIHLIGALEGFDVSTPVMPLLLKDVTVHGIATGHRRALEALVHAVDHTGLVPVVDTIHPLAELHLALNHLDKGPFGKIVIEMDS